MAEEEDDSQKTEDPSDRKLLKARERGEVAQSQEVKTWLILLGGTAGLILMGPSIGSGIRDISNPFIENAHAIPTDFDHLRLMLNNLSMELGLLLAPIMGLLLLLAIVSNVAQFGFMFAPEKVKFDASKISLLKGAKRMFSQRAIMEFLKGILKLFAVGAVSFYLAMPWLEDLTLMVRMEFGHSLDRIIIISSALAAGTIGVMTLVAIMDFAFQKHQFTKKMRMTKQEVKDEHKQSEGDPHVKARIRKIRTEQSCKSS